jgi:dipeptidyl aminopeptidase/acylaminoacyl peptidase
VKRLLILGAVAASLAVAGAAPSARMPALLTYSLLDPNGTTFGLCLARPDGARRVRLTRGVDYRPSWSPEGRFVAFQRHAAPGMSRVLIADTRGRIVRRFERANVNTSDPAWSRDGRRIAYSAWKSIVVATRTGQTIAEFPTGPAAGSPTWSPDGRRLAFAQVQETDGQGTLRRIYVINADGTGRRLLVSDASDPAWSPSGGKIAYIAYASRFAESGHATVANADGTGARRLTAGTQPEGRPAWSPNGRLIAFARSTFARGSGSSSAIVVTKPDGSSERVAVRSAAYGAVDPAWRPPVALPRARRQAC